jgi:aspartate racemase
VKVFGKKVIGVLGGMGPGATVRFYQLIIENCQKMGLKNNDEYPHIIIYNLPVPDLVSNRRNNQIALDMIIHGLRKMESFGADFIVIPCNTMHLYIDTFRRSVDLPIISLVEEVVNRIEYQTVGILGSKTSITSMLYQSKLKKRGISYVIPKDVNKISDIIKRIISGDNTEEDKQIVQNEIRQMKGAEAVILGCTEHPLIIRQQDVDIPVFDTLDILARKTVEEAIRYETLKSRNTQIGADCYG